MFNLWQAALAREEYLRQEREVRMELRQQKKEQKQLMQLQLEISRREKGTSSDNEDEITDGQTADEAPPAHAKAEAQRQVAKQSDYLPVSVQPTLGARKGSRLSLSILNRFGVHGKRSHSSDRLALHHGFTSETSSTTQQKLVSSPSMPTLSNFLDQDEQQGNRVAVGEDEGMEHSSHSETSVIMI